MIEPLAEAVRSESRVSGINVAGYVQKIGLFADDVVLTVTNPAFSLARLQVLQTYGAISYYKSNITKLCILPINIPKKQIS